MIRAKTYIIVSNQNNKKQPDESKAVVYARRNSQETARTIALIGIFVILLIYGLREARDVLLPVTLGILFAFLLGTPVRWLVRWNVPRGLAAFIVMVAALSGLSGIVYLLSTQAYAIFSELPNIMTEMDARLKSLEQSFQAVQDVGDAIEDIAEPILSGDETRVVALDGDTTSDNILESAQVFLTISVFTVVLLYFILSSGDLFIRKLIRVLPKRYDAHAVYYSTVKVEHELGLYLVSTFLINSGLGLCVGLMLWGLGMPNPLFWGVMAGLMNFIPYVGSVVMVVLVGTVAMGVYSDWADIGLVLALYLSLTAIEGFIVTPVVHGKRLQLNAAMVFFSLIVWGALWGLPGLFLAVPITATMKVIFDQVPGLSPIGVFLGR